MDCPFCNINKEKTRIIKEKSKTFVILSNPRLMPGHLLIIPKRHVENLSELSTEERKELFDTLIEFQEKILKNIASGVDMRQNYRPFQKQDNLKVNHLHIHLQPRELFDELYEKCQIFEKNVFKELSKEEMEKFSKLLK
ncbi:HIT family protein [Candidatus Woesearchaeota archaeon]|nr:HIT family protein [Candidatus Woesearchaeota archaeon]